jgi:hypothetical protein
LPSVGAANLRRTKKPAHSTSLGRRMARLRLIDRAPVDHQIDGE